MGPNVPHVSTLAYNGSMHENHALEPRGRGSMPKMSKIASAWEGLGAAQLRALFPDLRCFGIGWGEPFCFRCGWLAPTPEAADYPHDWPAERTIRYAWDRASAWLERAHLHDHSHGGPEEPLNLVPLCPLCHEQQPVSRTRETGIAFVNEGPDVPPVMAKYVQMCTDGLFRGDTSRPEKGAALRGLLRAHSIVGVALAKTLEKYPFGEGKAT
jgi:hypothetical protein